MVAKVEEPELQTPSTTPPPSSSTSSAPTATFNGSESFLKSVECYFPNAFPTSKVRTLVHQALLDRDYTHTNTLLASSICPDEINSKPHLSLAPCLHEDLLGGCTGGPGMFALGGLAGLPFAGISGLHALFSHAPHNVVIVLGPHVGISQSGDVGHIERGAAAGLSTACGAALGAGQKLWQEKLLAHKHHHDGDDGSSNNNTDPHPCEVHRFSFLDFEEDVILQQLRSSVEAMPDDLTDAERNAQITSLLYTMSLEMFLQVLNACWSRGACPDHVNEITLLAGIIINQGEGEAQEEHDREDFFQPKVFQTWVRPAETNSWSDASTSTTPVIDLFNFFD